MTELQIESTVYRKVIRKVDLRILPFLALLYFVAFLDRVNIGNVHAIINKDLQMTESQYAAAVGIFFAGYVIFEIPSNLMLKKIRPSRWIARIMVSWGILSMCMAAARSFTAILIVRFLLGAAEAGFFPGAVYYLTFWYSERQRASRIAWFYSAAAFAGAFAGLLAYSILIGMDGVAGLQAYQWVFIIEGIPSVILGVVTWFYLPNFPKTATFLSQEEKKIIIKQLDETECMEMEQICEDDSSEEKLNNTSKKFFHTKAMISTLFSKVVWYFALIYFLVLMPLYSTAFFLPALLGKLGVNIVMANLLTVPIYSIAAAFTIFWSYHSDKKQERAWHLALSCLMGAVGFIGLAIWGDNSSKESFAVAYISSILAITGVYPTIACSLAWLTGSLKRGVLEKIDGYADSEKDLVKSTAMATGTAAMVSLGNIGGIVGPLIFSSSLDAVSSYWIAHLVMSFSLLLTAILSLLANRKEFFQWLCR